MLTPARAHLSNPQPLRRDLTASWPSVSGATSYHVTYSSDGMNSWNLAAYDHATTTITISNVDNHKSYVVGVRAKNAHGGSEWRNSDSIAPQVPAAPSSVNLSRGNGTLTANWPAVSGATKYHITYSSDGGWNWNLAVYPYVCRPHPQQR